MASNTASLASATKMREEEHAKFNADEKDMILSIDSLKNAIVVMAKSQGEGRALKSFLQTDSSMVAESACARSDYSCSQVLLLQFCNFGCPIWAGQTWLCQCI